MSDFWDDTGPGDVSPPGTGGWVRQLGWGSRPEIDEYDARVLELREPAPVPEERPVTPPEPKARPERHLRLVEASTPIVTERPPEPPAPPLRDRLPDRATFLRAWAEGMLAGRRVDDAYRRRSQRQNDAERRR